MSNETINENSVGPALAEAEKLLDGKQYEASYEILKKCWLENINDAQAVKLLGRLLEAAGNKELGDQLHKLAATDKSKMSDDPQNLFESAFHLIDARQYELATMLLTRCVELVPTEPIINYELGFALMSMRRHAQAIPYFELALAPCDDFDTLLNLAVSYACTRNLEGVKDMLARIGKLELNAEQELELKHQRTVILRLEDLGDKFDFNARDWLYVQYGLILLRQNEEKGAKGKFKAVWNDYAQIASTLVILKGILDGLGISFEVIEYYSTLSRPLAECIAELFGVHADSYKGPDRVESTLLVMAWASDIIGPHQTFVTHQSQRSIFAYGLSCLEALPVTPEITGFLTESCAMPWDEHWKVEEYDDGRPPAVEHIPASTEAAEEIAAKILNLARDLESDPSIIRLIEEAVSYYRPKEHFLVLNNAQHFPRRPEYSAEVP